MTYGQLYTRIGDGNDAEDITIRLQSIYEILCKILSSNGNSSIQSKIPKLKILCDSIIQAIRLKYEYRHTEAIQLLLDTFFQETGCLNTFTLQKGTSLYRMRDAVSYVNYTKDTPNEMFHVPFELRYKVGNDRYNTSGIPTFYLSSSVYGCWEEVNRPNIDFANVALFKPTSDLLFLDMTLPPQERTIDTSTILGLPLVLASRLKVKHIGARFIPEYIIPQLAMECLVAKRDLNTCNIQPMIGIRYDSIHQNKRDLLFDEFYKDDIFVNYAIPPFEIKDNGVCPKIKNMFEFWKNTSWAEIKYRNVDISATAPKTHYDQSVFGIIETRLNLIPPGMLTYRTRNIGGIPPGALTI